MSEETTTAIELPPPDWHKMPHVVLRPDQKGLRFEIDRQRALIVFDLMIQRLRDKGVPYNYALVPQASHAFPKTLQSGTREHAIYLFVACLWMRGGTESDTAMNFLAPLFDAHPHLFTPEYFLPDAASAEENTKKPEMLVAEVAKALTDFRLGQRVDENSVGWVYNMLKLAAHWKGDPRTLMSDKPTFDDLSERIITHRRKQDDKKAMLHLDKPGGFMYFQEKMAAMIAYFLMDAGLVPMFYAPVPVDIHVLRILVSNLIIRPIGLDVDEAIGVDFYRAEVRALAREVTEWYCRQRQVSPVAMGDALWLLSRSLCRNNPGNSGYAKDSKRQREDKLRRKKLREEGLSSPLFDLAEIEMSQLERMSAELQGKREKTQGESIENNDESGSNDGDGTLIIADDGAGEESGRKRYMGLRFHTATIWDDVGRTQRFHRSCGQCPLKETCVYNITSSAYYIRGVLLPERRRQIAPTGDQYHFLEHADFKESHKPRIHSKVRFAEIDFAG